MPFAIRQWPSAECTSTYGTWNSTFPVVVMNCTTASTMTVVPAWTPGTNATAYSAWNQTFPAIIQGCTTVPEFFEMHITVTPQTSQQVNPESRDRILREANAYAQSRARRTPERAAARAHERDQARVRIAAAEREHAAANVLAEDLLMACLSPQQAADHIATGWFDVVSSRGRRFRIFTKTPADARYYPGQAGNVVLLDRNGDAEARYCVHPPDSLPDADAWLAQKLALESDEDSVMSVANMPWSRSGYADIRLAAYNRQHGHDATPRLTAVA